MGKKRALREESPSRWRSTGEEFLASFCARGVGNESSNRLCCNLYNIFEIDIEDLSPTLRLNIHVKLIISEFHGFGARNQRARLELVTDVEGKLVVKSDLTSPKLAPRIRSRHSHFGVVSGRFGDTMGKIATEKLSIPLSAAPANDLWVLCGRADSSPL